MRWIVGLALGLTIVILFSLLQGDPAVHTSAQVASARPATSIIFPVIPSSAQAGSSMPEQIADPVPVSVEPTFSSTDQAAVADLFESQARDAPWADAAENAIRQQVRGNYPVSCRQIMCRVSIPAPAPFDTPEQNAVIATSGLPTSLSYNQYTATLTDNGRGKLLTFYVTRTDMNEPSS